MLLDRFSNINIDGYSSKLLGSNELTDIEKLFYDSSDYFIIEQGKPANENEAKSLLEALPPNKTYEEKFVIGVYNEKSELAALVDIVKDFPEEAVWMLGLLLVSPNERGKGLGKAISNQLIEIVRYENGRKIRIGVVNNNEVGLKFWKSQGYIEEKDVVIINKDKVSNVIVMNNIL